jgi:hypothetical protein
MIPGCSCSRSAACAGSCRVRSYHICFAVTLVRADTLPAVPYVDQILYFSFDVHPVAGLAVLGGGVMLLLVPAIVGWRRDTDNRTIYAALGAVWFAAITSTALGN